MLSDRTVREAITMSAVLRLPSKTKEEQTALVDKMIETLHLEDAEKTFIGNASIKGVSGGERY